MSEILFFHHSSELIDKFSANYRDRPLFLWYADRWCHYQGSDKYLYFFLIDPKRDGIELRARSWPSGFDMMHKNMLHYKGWCEGNHLEWCQCKEQGDTKYEEAGIATTFDAIKPTVTLIARSYGSSLDEEKQIRYEIVTPYKPFTKRVINLFEGPYEEPWMSKPLRFADIPELVELMPSLPDALPFKDIKRDEEGMYHYDEWLEISNPPPGIWWV